MRSLYGDAQKLFASLVLGVAGPPLIAIVTLISVVSFAYCAGQRTGKQSLQVAALVDTVRITDSVAVVRTDTVVRVQRRVDTVRARSDALDSAVVIVNDSTVQTPDTVAVIPEIVVANLAALRLTVATQDTLILSLYQRDSTRVWQIESRDKLIRQLSTRHPFACGRRCGFVLGLSAGILLHKAAK